MISINKLPFPGYSWSLSQHAIALEPETLFGFLKCASLFEGVQDPGRSITKLMIAQGLLTPNYRDAQPDAWRDYQQILAEVGLIYSTQAHPELKLTEVGQMLLAGDIGFSELMTVQALRYQYPNGQKTTIQSGLRSTILSENSSASIPQTLLELHVNSGILIKPGLLVLRVMLERFVRFGIKILTVDECQAFLIPILKNSDWGVALTNIQAATPEDNLSSINRHSRRNIQDWFKFLGKTDLFDLVNGHLSLSSFALHDIDNLKDLCSVNEDAGTFWIPTAFDRASKIRWFDYFGESPISLQILLRTELTEDYIASNYIEGLDLTEEDEFVVSGVSVPPIALNQVTSRNTQMNSNLGDMTEAEIQDLLDRFHKGNIKRLTKSALHDSIVFDLANYFQTQGAVVYEDRDSVDLLVQWGKNIEGVFEVKTVNKRSIQDRLRTAIGQVSEYSYRRHSQTGVFSDKVVVINSQIDSESWQIDFLNNHMGIGLICKTQSHYKAYSPSSFLSKGYWESFDRINS